MKIFVVGTENYNSSVGSEKAGQVTPIIYTKADSALLKDRKPFFIPDDMGRIGYTGELVVRICRLGKEVPERFAHRYYDAFTVGLNFKASEMLRDCSANGMPWTVATGFDGSAIIGEWIPVENFAGNVEFGLDSNGSTLYTANVSNMIIGIDRLISYLSHYFTLKTGDLLFTGTVSIEEEPHINDLLEGYINGMKVLECRCK